MHNSDMDASTPSHAVNGSSVPSERGSEPQPQLDDDHYEDEHIDGCISFL